MLPCSYKSPERRQRHVLAPPSSVSRPNVGEENGGGRGSGEEGRGERKEGGKKGKQEVEIQGNRAFA